MNVKLTVQYDGTNYHGWQMQANGRTIQGDLTRVLSLLDRRPITLHGAGRTDAGVHALGQVASCHLERPFTPDTLRAALNGNLDRDIRVTHVEMVGDGFNARFSARRKTYRYRIATGEVVSPFDYRYVYHYRGPLDLDAMRRAAAHLTGTHDFSAFAATTAEVRDRVRSLTRLDLEPEGEEVVVYAEADGFLQYMVRTIAGTLIEVGRGRRTAEDVRGALRSRERARAGPTAPAAGLTLLRVDY